MSEQQIVTESGAVNHPNVQLIKRYQAAMASGDFALGATFFAPQVRYTVPGDNPLSGDFVGGEQVMAYFGKLMEMTEGSYKITEMRWLVSGDEVALVTANHATRGDRALTWYETLVFTIKDGKKQAIRLFQADQAAVDAFYA